jgi:hypothetical protein
VIAIAERLGAAHVAMTVHRHFRASRPAHCAAFELAVTWYHHAVECAEMKWPRLAPQARRSASAGHRR